MEENIKETVNELKEEQTSTLETNQIETKEANLSRKEKRLLEIKNRLFKEEDIKYEGPLSYRYLRILAWIFLAFGQIVLLNSFSASVLHVNTLGVVGSNILNIFAGLSTPLFVLASFGLVLSGHRKIRDYVFVYGLAYLGIGLGFIFFYLRYINGLFVEIGIDQTPFLELFNAFLSDKVQVNVFADLFAFAAFHFFMNYKPVKVFKDKSITVFRLFSLIPIIFVFVSYVLKILTATGKLTMPFFIFPFLTTKSPLVYLVFVVADLWIKNRKKWYLRLGASEEEYSKFLKTNRNSLSVSIHLSIIIAVSVIFDVLLLFIAIIYFAANQLPSDDFVNVTINTFGVGQPSAMLLAVPFIFLYSYKRKHKDRRIDIIIPIVGIALIGLVYVEGIYQFILQFLNSH